MQIIDYRHRDRKKYLLRLKKLKIWMHMAGGHTGDAAAEKDPRWRHAHARDAEEPVTRRTRKNDVNIS